MQQRGQLCCRNNVIVYGQKLDMIVANDVSAPDSGFGVDTNRVTFIFPDGKEEQFPLLSKAEVAETIVAHLGELLETR